MFIICKDNFKTKTRYKTAARTLLVKEGNYEKIL